MKLSLIHISAVLEFVALTSPLEYSAETYVSNFVSVSYTHLDRNRLLLKVEGPRGEGQQLPLPNAAPVEHFKSVKGNRFIHHFIGKDVYKRQVQRLAAQPDCVRGLRIKTDGGERRKRAGSDCHCLLYTSDVGAERQYAFAVDGKRVAPVLAHTVC